MANSFYLISRVFFMSFSFILLTLFSPFSVSSANFFLSADEAAQLQLSNKEWTMPPLRTRGGGTSLGPIIDFQAPTITDAKNPTLETVSPLSLIILFQRNNADVDMKSLKVLAKKGFFKKNLTERLQPYVQGTSLKASGLDIPKGKFKIQIIIADVYGNQTSVEYRLMVGD